MEPEKAQRLKAMQGAQALIEALAELLECRPVQVCVD